MNSFRIELSILVILLIFSFASQPLAEEIKIARPLGGWRYSDLPAWKYSNTVAKIRGRVTKSIKKQKPFRLIVNGVPMFMKVRDRYYNAFHSFKEVQYGYFSRPYSLGPGSNNVEIRSNDGKAVSRVQFYEAYPSVTQPRLRIILSWDTEDTDLDLHVVTPDGEHCFYDNRVLKNGGYLDMDVTSGYGPEIFATQTPIKGTYLILLNYYESGDFDGGYSDSEEVEGTYYESKSHRLSMGKDAYYYEERYYIEKDDIIVAQVTAITQENTPDEKIHTITVPMTPKGLTLVGEFVYP